MCGRLLALGLVLIGLSGCDKSIPPTIKSCMCIASCDICRCEVKFTENYRYRLRAKLNVFCNTTNSSKIRIIGEESYSDTHTLIFECTPSLRLEVEDSNNVQQPTSS